MKDAGSEKVMRPQEKEFILGERESRPIFQWSHLKLRIFLHSNLDLQTTWRTALLGVPRDSSTWQVHHSCQASPAHLWSWPVQSLDSNSIPSVSFPWIFTSLLNTSYVTLPIHNDMLVLCSQNWSGWHRFYPLHSNLCHVSRWHLLVGHCFSCLPTVHFQINCQSGLAKVCLKILAVFLFHSQLRPSQ